MLKTAIALLSVAAALQLSHGSVVGPLVGFGQGLQIQVTPGATTNDQCNIYGIPTASGYADRGAGPLFLYTPKFTGNHVLSFIYDKDAYNMDPILTPGQNILTIDATDRQNPLIAFDSNNSPQGQQSAVTLYLKDKSDAPVCFVQIQLTIEASLSCLPSYGGLVVPGGGSCGGGCPSTFGTFVVPSGVCYAPVYVTQIIIQSFVSITNINIQNIILNVQQVTSFTFNKNITVLPPAPTPLNCTLTPLDTRCAKTPSCPNCTIQTIPAIIPPLSGDPSRAPPPFSPLSTPPSATTRPATITNFAPPPVTARPPPTPPSPVTTPPSPVTTPPAPVVTPAVLRTAPSPPPPVITGSTTGSTTPSSTPSSFSGRKMV